MSPLALTTRLRALMNHPRRWALAEPQQAATRAQWTADPPSAFCYRCGASVAVEAMTLDGCPFCVNTTVAWQRIVRLGTYIDPLDDWIIRMKFAGAWWYAPWFGEQLAGRVASIMQGRCVVCPVPMPRLRRWRRGYNQAFLMAEALGRTNGWPIERLLVRTRHTAPQTTVAPSKRRDNVRDSIAMRRSLDLAGWQVCLVDDIKTTGATATVCAKLLTQAGADAVVLTVAAVADPRGRNFKQR